MRKWITKICALLLGLGLMWELAKSEPITRYQHITNLESTRFNEMIWFWGSDTSYGIIRSNDYLAFRDGYFSGLVITAQDSIINRNARFATPPITNAPPYRFPDSYPHLRRYAQYSIDDDDGRLMTRLQFSGGLIEVYQYELGRQRHENLVRRIWHWDDIIIRVYGEVEVSGVLNGRVTIYSRGDMWLTDDIRYEGSDRSTGWFDEDRMESMLGLVSDRNIIIKNSQANGRGDGYNEDRDNHDRHSIIINGSLVALNESFTFEHQNDDRDRYQGPTPDERGIIHLKGGVAQWRRGHLHRSNHDGTGYGKDYHWDFRLDRDGPPGFGPGEYPDVMGRYDDFYMFMGDYNVQNATFNTLRIRAGVEVVLRGFNSITVMDSLIIEGTANAPVTFRLENDNAQSSVRMFGGQNSLADLRWLRCEGRVVFNLEADSIDVDNCDFTDEVWLEGSVSFDSSTVAGEADFTSWDRLYVTRSLFSGGMRIRGNAVDGRIYHNTIVEGRYAGLTLDRFRQLDIRNNIIAFNGVGIENRSYSEPDCDYNDVFGNRNGNWDGVERGGHSISNDPRFIDIREGDYDLNWNSPCIDAGDTTLGFDPDGSAPDLGAYYRDAMAIDEPVQDEIPQRFAMSVFPNPFNSTTTIKYDLPIPSSVSLEVYNRLGQRMAVLFNGARAAGVHANRLTAADLPSGLYFVRLEAASKVATRKVMLVR